MIDGEIVYLPSETILADSNIQSKVKSLERLTEPKTAIMVSKLEKGTYRCKVYINGNYWYVKENQMFSVGRR